MPAPRKYPNELLERAQRLVAEAMSEDPESSLNRAVVRIGVRDANSATAPSLAREPAVPQRTGRGSGETLGAGRVGADTAGGALAQ